MSVVAFVPARSGSKRLPDKNIRPLAGKPLAAWTVQACLDAQGVDLVLFSTDSDMYWAAIRAAVDDPHDRLRRHVRDAEDAGDHVKIFDYLKAAHGAIFPPETMIVVLALPTAPLRGSAHIDACLALYRSDGRAVFSAAPYRFPVSFAFTTGGAGGWAPLSADSPMVTGQTRSQDQIAAFHPNGAVYVCPRADLDDPGLRSFYEDATPYLMTRADSADVDDVVDFALAETLMRLRSGGAS